MNDELKATAKLVDEIQNACNLRAVVGEFGKVLDVLMKSKLYGDDLKRHPLTICMVSKIVSLTGFNSETESDAFQKLFEMTKGE